MKIASEGKMKYTVIHYLENAYIKFPDKIVCGDDIQEITYKIYHSPQISYLKEQLFALF